MTEQLHKKMQQAYEIKSWIAAISLNLESIINTGKLFENVDEDYAISRIEQIEQPIKEALLHIRAALNTDAPKTQGEVIPVTREKLELILNDLSKDVINKIADANLDEAKHILNTPSKH